MRRDSLPQHNSSKRSTISQLPELVAASCCNADLLKKTEAMREQRKAERLADYYRRNFREYLTFDNGAAKNRVRAVWSACRFSGLTRTVLSALRISDHLKADHR